MKKPWWRYLSYLGLILLFGGAQLMKYNMLLGGIVAGIGFATGAVYFFMQQKNS